MATVENPTSKVPAEAPDIPRPLTADRRIRFNVEQYYKMAEAGILKRSDRVELIDGDILVMCPISGPHHGCVNYLNEMLSSRLPPRAIVSVQGPVRLNDLTEPEPDVAVLKPRPDYYRSAHAGPSDVLLIIEVMVTSAHDDRKFKLGHYALSGLPEVWLVDLDEERIEVYSRPESGSYTEVQIRKRGQSLAPGAFPDVVLAVDAILG